MKIFANEAELVKDYGANLLIDYLKSNKASLELDEDTCLYYNLPLYQGDSYSSKRARIMLLNRWLGLLLFDVNESRSMCPDINTNVEDFYQTYSQLLSHFIKSSILRTGRDKVIFPFEQILFLPNFVQDLPDFDDIFTFCDLSQIGNLFLQLKLSQPLDENIIHELRAIIEGSKALNSELKKRNIAQEDKTSKGYLLQRIETRIKNFDEEQNMAANIIIDGPQRIRGLAGSGKTIVLAKKAALIHLQNPDAKILYTFYTKSLYDITKMYITKFYRQFADKDPDWNNLHILHSWGGKSVGGVYYNQCIRYNCMPETFKGQKFNNVCQRLLEKVNIEPEYDYVILDEAQDFEKYFFRLCLKLAKNKKFIWGYDQCQNILDVEIQDTKTTFGTDGNGNYLVDLDSEDVDNDIILHKCYRNPNKIIFFAFAFGLGIYNDKIVQMLENNSHWEDLGFNIVEGESKVGDNMVIRRDIVNSPLDIKNDEEIINLKIFPGTNNINEECKYVADRIEQDIKSNLYPDDIMVLSLDQANCGLYFETLEFYLKEKNICCYNMYQKQYGYIHFYKENCVTLTTIYNAKGNEAASVYIIGIDGIYLNNEQDTIKNRNKIFTALTRTKYWLTITGIGENSLKFKSEYERIKENYPYLRFVMPDINTVNKMQRDLSQKNNKLNKKRKIKQQYNMSDDDLKSLIK